MAEKLLTSDVVEWYRKLNVARQQSGVGLAAKTVPKPIKTDTTTPVNQLITDIKSSIRENSFLGLATDTSVPVVSKEVIELEEKQKINNTIMSLLRVCPNVTCQTTLVTEAMNSNVAHNNGTKSNGDNTCSDWYMCAHNGSGFGGLQDAGWAGSAANWVGLWGTSSTTCGNGKNTHGSNTNGGNSNQYYQPGTATYTAKDGYTETQAGAR